MALRSGIPNTVRTSGAPDYPRWSWPVALMDVESGKCRPELLVALQLGVIILISRPMPFPSQLLTKRLKLGGGE